MITIRYLFYSGYSHQNEKDFSIMYDYQKLPANLMIRNCLTVASTFLWDWICSDLCLINSETALEGNGKDYKRPEVFQHEDSTAETGDQN